MIFKISSNWNPHGIHVQVHHKRAWLSSRKNALYLGVAIKRTQTVIRPTRPPLPKSCLQLRGRCCGKPDCRWVPRQGNMLFSHPDLIQVRLKPIKWKCLLPTGTRHGLLASVEVMMLSLGFIQGNVYVLILTLNHAANTHFYCFSWCTWSAALMVSVGIRMKCRIGARKCFSCLFPSLSMCLQSRVKFWNG